MYALCVKVDATLVHLLNGPTIEQNGSVLRADFSKLCNLRWNLVGRYTNKRYI